MSTQQFDSVKQRLEGYVEGVEHWKVDHHFATECLDLELLLQHGISVYQAINFLDNAMREFVLTGKTEYSAENETAIADLYEWWFRPCDRILKKIDEFEARDFRVEYAEEFRGACIEVQGCFTDDEAFFSGGDLVTLRDRAIDSLKRGECEQCDPE